MREHLPTSRLVLGFLTFVSPCSTMNVEKAERGRLCYKVQPKICRELRVIVKSKGVDEILQLPDWCP